MARTRILRQTVAHQRGTRGWGTRPRSLSLGFAPKTRGRAMADIPSPRRANFGEALACLGRLSLRDLSTDSLLETVADLVKTVPPTLEQISAVVRHRALYELGALIPPTRRPAGPRCTWACCCWRWRVVPGVPVRRTRGRLTARAAGVTAPVRRSRGLPLETAADARYAPQVRRVRRPPRWSPDGSRSWRARTRSTSTQPTTRGENVPGTRYMFLAVTEAPSATCRPTTTIRSGQTTV